MVYENLFGSKIGVGGANETPRTDDGLCERGVLGQLIAFLENMHFGD
ncbi:hypothetical protein BH09VER1_BH09VER1_10990 [soil metagenome]